MAKTIFNKTDNLYQEQLHAYKGEIERLKNALDYSLAGLIIFNKSGTIRFANKLWARMHKFREKEILGKNYSMFYDKRVYSTEVKPLLSELNNRSLVLRESVHKRKDGTTFPTLLRLMVSKDYPGNVDDFFVYALDITAQKKREEELQLRTRELQRFQKLTVDRELKMIELKKKIAELERQ